PRPPLFPYTTLFRSMDNPRLRRDCREDYTEISRKPHRHCRDRARLDHEKKRPAIKKSPKRRIGFAQIHILPARMRKECCQFAIRSEEHTSELQSPCN